MKFIKYISTLFVTMVVLFGYSVAQAQPYITFDARTMGMGGSSVASSHLADAAYSNPALVSEPIGDNKFQLILPVVGINLNDPQGLINDVEDFNTAIDNLDPVAADEILTRSLGKPLTVAANAGAAFGFIVNKFAMVFIYNRQYLVDLRTRGLGLTTATLQGRGVELSEIGVALPLYSGTNFKFGITPKIVKVKSYEYFQPLVDASGNIGIWNTDLGEKSHDSSLNMDLGAAYDFKNGFVLGLVARNLNSQEYTTILNNIIKLDPLMRAGVAYNGSIFTIAIDADLTENDAIAFSEKTQLVTLGIEVNIFDWMALRAGYQKNTASINKDSMTSLGLGFTPFGFGIDISAMGNSHEIGGAVQLSFTF